MVVVPVVYVEVEVMASAVCHLVMIFGNGNATMLCTKRKKTKSASIV